MYLWFFLLAWLQKKKKKWIIIPSRFFFLLNEKYMQRNLFPFSFVLGTVVENNIYIFEQLFILKEFTTLWKRYFFFVVKELVIKALISRIISYHVQKKCIFNAFKFLCFYFSNVSIERVLGKKYFFNTFRLIINTISE